MQHTDAIQHWGCGSRRGLDEKPPDVLVGLSGYQSPLNAP
jgi:hypothetical protein